MFKNGESTIRWDTIDIKMAIKRYFYKLDRDEQDEALTSNLTESD
jgi:hypothetical protein